MLKRRFDGKTLESLFLLIAAVVLSWTSDARAESWSVNPSDFRYDMSLYFKVASMEPDVLEAYEIGAFIGDQCCGVAENLSLPDDSYCLYMRIRSNSTEASEVSFTLRDKATGKTSVLRSSDGTPFIFKADSMVGLPSEPFTLVRCFEIKVNALEHGSVEFEDGLYAEGSELLLKAVPDEGYHFESWSDGDTVAERTLIVTGDIELTASFAPNVYKVVFKIDGEEFASEEVVFGGKITAPEVAEKEGYTFSGWSEIPETMPAKDIEITGSFTVNKYLLTVYLDDEVYMEVELDYGAEITIPAPEVKEGMVFDGWSEEVPATMPAHDLTIHGTTSKDMSGVESVVSSASSFDIFTLGGVLVRKGVRSEQLEAVKASLPAGVYIINGVKYVVK